MASTIGTAYIQIEPSTKGIGSKISGEMSSAGSEGGKSFSNGFASVVGNVGKVAAGAIAAGGAAVGALVKESVSAYGEFEQLVGGVETLFDNTENIQSFREALLDMGVAGSAVEEQIRGMQQPVDIVMENAANAYQTAGLSANEYMQTVTGMASALNQSTGDFEVSAKMADMAVTDMADNANKMGSSMESIQNAYAGFAKQNYTMLDNLKLGYGGTKEEMQRLLEDATELSGVEYDLSSYADIVDAIHVIQTDLGITGTTAKEASTTIQGSAATMSAAWQNLVTGMGTQGADLSGLITSFVDTVKTFISNLTPVIMTALQGVSQLVSEVAPILANELPGLVTAVLPELLVAGLEVVKALAEGIINALPELMPTIIELVTELGNFIIENLPMLIDAAVQIIIQLADGITQAIPQLIPTIVDVVLKITETLIDNLDLLVEAAVKMIIALNEGLLKALPTLVAKAPIIIGKLLVALMEAIKKIQDAGVKIILMLGEGVESAKQKLYDKIPEIIEKLKNTALEKAKSFLEVGKNIVEGIKQGISNAWDDIVGWLSGMCEDLLDIVKKALGIHSPSRVFADEVGQWIPAGIAKGIKDGMSALDSEIESMALSTVKGSIGIESDIANYKYRPDALSGSASDMSALLSLMSTYLPAIARKDNVNVVLEGDAGRLFRLMQNEQRRNAELVGV